MADESRAGGATAPASRYGKYNSRNPISRRLVSQLLATVKDLVAPLGPDSFLDVGCGEGIVQSYLAPALHGARCAAIDLDPVDAATAARNLPWCDVRVGSVYDLPFDTRSFDLVLCCEVLEHLEHPDRALDELCRVSSKHVLVSVPREPLWRALNMARGYYLKAWGNTPDHVNHWTRGGFEAFVGHKLRILERRSPLPWTVILAAKN